MPTVNVDGAAARLRAMGTVTIGKCLQHCWEALSGGLQYLTGGNAYAYATWEAVPEANRHNGDRNVPKDFPAFLGPRTGNIYGDVIISNGDGTFSATDWPTNGLVGICTLDQRLTQTARPYLGWADSMAGYDLVSTSTASGGKTPIPEEIPMERILTVSDTSGKTVKNGESYYWKDGTSFPVGPLSGTVSTFGDLYSLNTIGGVAIMQIGGATYEAYAGLQVARAQAYSNAHTPAGSVTGSAATGFATPTDVNAARDAIIAKIPTKLA